jgi:hypothetical protein
MEPSTSVVIAHDLETVGDNLWNLTVINYGAVAYEDRGIGPAGRRKIGQLSVNMIPGTPDPKQVEWWNSTPELKATYESFKVDAKTPEVAMAEIRAWMASMRQGYKEVYTVACPTIFDGTFLYAYWMRFPPAQGPRDCRGTGLYKMIDVRSYGAGVLGCSYDQANKDKEFAPYMPDPALYPHTHTGMDDAEEQLLLYFALKDVRSHMHQ